MISLIPSSLAYGALIGAGIPLLWAIIRGVIGKMASTPDGRAHGAVLADLLASAEPLVLQAEQLQIPGADKGELVIKQLAAILQAKGFSGDAQKLYTEYLPHLVELALARVAPKAPTLASVVEATVASIPAIASPATVQTP